MSTSGGKFVTLEGIEGAGKSTLARALEAALRARALPLRVTREPGGTPLAERLRELVLARGQERISAEAETLLMFAARAVHVDNLIRPALQAGEWVLCDRFTDATRAYQGSGRGVSSELIERLARSVHADLWPHRTLLLDLPAEQGLLRARARTRTHAGASTGASAGANTSVSPHAGAHGEAADRFEDEDRGFFERVRTGYLKIAAAEPQRVRILDARAAPALLAQRALEALADLLPPRPAGAGHSGDG